MNRLDDDIYDDFKENFPELFENDASGIATIDEDAMKSKDNKLRWHNFLNRLIRDHSFCHITTGSSNA